MTTREEASALGGLTFVDPHRSGGRYEVIPAAGSPLPWPRLPDEEAATALQSLRFSALGRTQSVASLTALTRGTSLLALHRGRLAHEWYADGSGPGTLFLGASMTKSLLSQLVGVAVDAGQLSLDDRAGAHVPQLSSSGYAEVTVRQLITMTTGTAWSEDYRDPSSPASRLLGSFFAPDARPSRQVLAEIGGADPPGTRYEYCTADSQVLDWVREAATGVGFVEAATRHWADLGAEHDAVVRVDSAGVAMAGGGVAAATTDWARIGELHRAGDLGRARLSQAWRQASASPAADFTRPGRLPVTITSHAGFGYHWWPLTDDGRRVTADGSRGQFTYVDEAARVVVVKTSQWPYDDIVVDRGCRDACYLALPEIARTVNDVVTQQESSRRESSSEP